ncbi:hypothetical protein WBO87_10660 [Nocardioides sp. CCNWLW212]
MSSGTSTAIAAGSYHSLALSTDGRVTAWGYDNHGQIDVPASLTGKTVTAIAGGLYHSLALTSDGHVTAWGNDFYGQSTVPASLAGKTVTTIAAGAYHSMAITSDGQLIVWGSDDSGQSTVPAPLAGKTVIAAAGGYDYTVAATSDGQVTSWGDNTYDQSTSPASLSSKKVTALAAGAYHALAITADLRANAAPLISGVARVGGALTAIAGRYNADPDSLAYVWKADSVAVGTNTATYRPSSSDIDKTITVTVTAKKAGYADTVTTSAATARVVAGGRVTAWGSNFAAESTVPASLARRSVTAIAAGFNHSVALTADAKVAAWGSGVQGTVPAALTTVNVTAIAAGTNHNLALTSAGRVLAWGNNSGGQTTIPPELDARAVIAIAAGNSHSLALTSDGQVIGWGSNTQGQTSIPAALSGVPVVAIAAGSNHSLALTSDGRVVAWGADGDLQSTVPVALTSQTVIAIAAGTPHSLALTSVGQVVAWGGNAQGQATVPSSLSGRTVVAIASGAGADHSLALTDDREVVAWGSNGSDQRVVPASLTGQPNTALAVGGAHSVALTAAVIADQEPTITGTPQVGTQLSAQRGTYNATATYGFQWYADDVAVPGATSSLYTPTAAQRGQTITVTVTAAKTGHATATDTSSGVGPVAAGTFTTGPAATIAGTPVVGGTLTASPGPTQTSSTSPTADSFTYQWSADDTEITGATGRTLTLTPDTVGALITVAITAHRDGYTDASDLSDPAGPVAQATFTTGPTATITGTPTVGRTLFAGVGDAAPSPDDYSYVWYADGVEITDNTSSDPQALNLTPALAGMDITVEVTAHRDGYTDASDLSDPVGPVTKATFTTGPTATITGTPVVNGTLTAGPGSTELGTTVPSADSFTYAWAADGEPITGATSHTLALTPALVGAKVTVTVSAVRSGYVDAADESDPTEPVESAVFTTGPDAVIDGEAVVGGTLIATPTDLDSTTPSADSYAYGWAADGRAIRGASGPTLTLSEDEVGKTVTVTVIATRAGYTDAADTSAPTVPVASATFSTGPTATISGTAQVGQTLRAGTGAPVPDPEEYRFAWSADGTPLAGATTPTLRLTPDLRGRRITVTVTAARAGYVDATDTSAPTAAVVTDRAPSLRLTLSVPRSSQDAATTPDGQPTVRRGRTITLRWTSSNAQSLVAGGELADLLRARYGTRPIPAAGSVRVRLTHAGAHAYRLRAINETGTTTATTSIVAVRRPTRLSVETPATTRPGRTIRIRVTGLGYRERFYVTVNDGHTTTRVRTGRANTTGNLTRRITIPRTINTTAKTIRVRVTGRSTKRAGAALIRLR